MERKAITLTLNLDEITILGAALIHAIRHGWSNHAIELMYPNADMDYLLEQMVIARNEVEGV